MQTLEYPDTISSPQLARRSHRSARPGRCCRQRGEAQLELTEVQCAILQIAVHAVEADPLIESRCLNGVIAVLLEVRLDRSDTLVPRPEDLVLELVPSPPVHALCIEIVTRRECERFHLQQDRKTPSRILGGYRQTSHNSVRRVRLSATGHHDAHRPPRAPGGRCQVDGGTAGRKRALCCMNKFPSHLSSLFAASALSNGSPYGGGAWYSGR